MGILEFFKLQGYGSEKTSRLEKWEINSSIKECCERNLAASIIIGDHAIDFLTMFIDSDPRRGLINLDLLIPDAGNRYIKEAESFIVYYKLNDIGHSFKSNFLGATKNNYPAIKISYPKKIESTQRREYFRVAPSTDAPVLLSITMGGESHQETKGTLRDISEGGLSLMISPEIAERFKAGTLLPEIKFNLPELGTINTKGVVRNIFEGEGEKYQCGIEFLKMPDNQRGNIYSYVLQRQRDAIKKLDKLKS